MSCLRRYYILHHYYFNNNKIERTVLLLLLFIPFALPFNYFTSPQLNVVSNSSKFFCRISKLHSLNPTVFCMIEQVNVCKAIFYF